MKITKLYKLNKRTKVEIPLITCSVPAGFPSPANDYIDGKLDLNEFLVKHPSATFFVKVDGESMIDAGIYSGDILIVDRSIKPANNKIAVVMINGEFTVKRLSISKNKISLLPENPNYDPIYITEDMDFEVWGIVTYVIHQPV